jgi:hypothetical protein
MGHDIGDWSPEAQARVQQKWWRDPSWGGHIIWNPQFGFQNLGSVQDFYKNWDPTTTPNWSKAFSQAGFTKQLSDAGNWREFYPDRPVVQNQPRGQQFNPWANFGQFQWGQQQQAPTQPAYGTDTAEDTTGFYSPQYGSTVKQHLPRQASRRYGSAQMTSNPGQYYGTTDRKRTSMRYGYKPSM